MHYKNVKNKALIINFKDCKEKYVGGFGRYKRRQNDAILF